MQIRLTTLAIVVAFALPTIAHAGGPVITADPETAPVVRDRDHTLPLILLGIVVAAIVLGGSDSPCHSEPVEPPPGGGC